MHSAIGPSTDLDAERARHCGGTLANFPNRLAEDRLACLDATRFGAPGRLRGLGSGSAVIAFGFSFSHAEFWILLRLPAAGVAVWAWK